MAQNRTLESLKDLDRLRLIAIQRLRPPFLI
jgi:hypothetical protein